MQQLFISAIYGVVQGATEFLPVSSSGHLVILHRFVPLTLGNDLFFDIILHLATIVAVIWFFRKDVFNLLLSWLKSFTGKLNSQAKLSWYLIIATIPAGLAGYFFENIIIGTRQVIIVIVMLIFIGILFIVVEKYSRRRLDMQALDLNKSLFIGLAQALALIPGTSRSGITIIAGMISGLKREEAIKFSFLLSIPIILGANLKKLLDPAIYNFHSSELYLYAASFIFATVTGIIAIKYFLLYSRKSSLKIFAYYRIILAGVILVLIMLD